MGRPRISLARKPPAFARRRRAQDDYNAVANERRPRLSALVPPGTGSPERNRGDAVVVLVFFLPVMQLLRAQAGPRRMGHPGRRRQPAVAVHRNLSRHAYNGATVWLGFVAVSPPQTAADDLSVLRRETLAVPCSSGTEPRSGAPRTDIL